MDVIGALLPMALLVAAVAGLVNFVLSWLLRRFLPRLHRAFIIGVVSAIWPAIFYIYFQSIEARYQKLDRLHHDRIIHNSAEGLEAEGRAMGEAIAVLGCLFFGVTSLLGGATGAVIATAKRK